MIQQLLKQKQIEHKYDPANLFLETYNYDVWFENEESTDTARKSDKTNLYIYHQCHHQRVMKKKVKEGKRLKILTLNKLLSTLPILVSQIKA